MITEKVQVNNDDLIRLKNMLTVLDERKHIWANTPLDKHIETLGKIKKILCMFQKIGFH